MHVQSSERNQSRCHM